MDMGRRLLKPGRADSIKSKLRDLPSETLSLYARAHKSPHRAFEVEAAARTALADSGAPTPVIEAALERTASPGFDGTLCVFVGEPQKPLALGFYGDIGALGDQDVHVSWGAPVLGPLSYAMDFRRRYGAVYVDGRRVRMFELFLDQIDELLVAFRDPSPGEGDPDQWRRRFYREVEADIAELSRIRGIHDVVLLGPEADVALLMACAQTEVLADPVARLPGLSRPGAPAEEVREKVMPVLADAIERADAALLTRVRERGVTGVRDTLRVLRAARLDTLVLSSRLRCTDDSNIEALPHLALKYGTEVVFITGAAADELLRDDGGVGGLRRW